MFRGQCGGETFKCEGFTGSLKGRHGDFKSFSDLFIRISGAHLTFIGFHQDSGTREFSCRNRAGSDQKSESLSLL